LQAKTKKGRRLIETFEKIINTSDFQARSTVLLKRALLAFYQRKLLSIPLLATELGVSIPTAGRLAAILTSNHFVRLIGEGPSGGGRKPRIYQIDEQNWFTLAVDAGREHLRIALFNLNDQKKAESISTLPLESSMQYLEATVSHIKRFLVRHHLKPAQVLGIGFAVPGLINTQTGRSLVHFTGFLRPVNDMLADMTGIPVVMDNDARLMAKGEASFGKAQHAQNAIYLFLDRGVGTGLLVNGEIYKGAHGFAGEFGHTHFVGHENNQCICGQMDCLETYTSLKALEKEAIRMGFNPPATGDAWVNIIEASWRGDKVAMDAIAEIGRRLGLALVNLVHLIDPEIIIIGGSLAMAGNVLTHSIYNTLRESAMHAFREDLRLELSGMGQDACLAGCHAMVMKNFFANV
jgi:predicted NBD/HSP70 family sugar kinase